MMNTNKNKKKRNIIYSYQNRHTQREEKAKENHKHTYTWASTQKGNFSNCFLLLFILGLYTLYLLLFKVFVFSLLALPT
jgi:hypothetical protein